MNKENFNQSFEMLESSNIETNKLDPIYGNDVPCAICPNEENNNDGLSIDRISEQIGQNVVQRVATYLDGFMSNINNRIPLQDDSTLSYLKELYKGATYDDRSTGKKYFSNHLINSKQDKTISMLDNLNDQVDQLKSLVESQNATIAEQTSIIKKQHETIARYESDVIYKTQKDLIMELIGIADQLRMTLNDYSTNKEIDLHDAIEQLEEWVNGSLQAVAVRKYINMDTQELDRKRQEIIEVQETSNPDEDGMLKSLLPGYIWAVPMVGSNEMLLAEDRPKKFEFMIRPEQMSRLHYVKKDNTPSDSDRSNSSMEIYDAIADAEPVESQSTTNVDENIESPESPDKEKSTKSKKSLWDKFL